jgi:transcriptional regulator with XRE-family HTH domain
MTTPETETETWVPDLNFGARLALVRHRMGWNIKEAAIACGVPAQSWRGWELDGREPHRLVTIALAIASRTGVDLNWLLGLDRDGRRKHNYGWQHLVAVGGDPMIGQMGTVRAVRQTRPNVGALRHPRSRASL